MVDYGIANGGTGTGKYIPTFEILFQAVRSGEPDVEHRTSKSSTFAEALDESTISTS